MSVGLPVFSIHGNHDDPQGTGPVRSFARYVLEDNLTEDCIYPYFARKELYVPSTFCQLLG